MASVSRADASVGRSPSRRADRADRSHRLREDHALRRNVLRSSSARGLLNSLDIDINMSLFHNIFLLSVTKELKSIPVCTYLSPFSYNIFVLSR